MIKKSWTLEECSSDAKKYSTRSQWADANRACYNFARKNSWLDKCCTHMPHREGVWTEDDCKQLLIHYGSPHGWAKKHYRAYKKAESLGLFKDYDYQNGQAKPTDAAYVVFEELSKELAGHLSKLDQIINADLKSLNDRLPQKISIEKK